MYYLVILAFTILTAWVIFKVARRWWREADIDEIKSKVKDTEVIYESAKDINTKRFQKQHDKVEEVKESTDL